MPPEASANTDHYHDLGIQENTGQKKNPVYELRQYCVLALFVVANCCNQLIQINELAKKQTRTAHLLHRDYNL